MRQAFVFEKVAVLIGPWHEPMDPPERGARVEVRLLADEPQRGSRSAAQRVVIDQPVFRADLFDQVNAAPGNLHSAHFHSRFADAEPCERQWNDSLQQDPTGWLSTQLGDLRELLERSGIATEDAVWLDGDALALRDAIPAIIAAIEAVWESVRPE
jgi:hypothetical protein